MFLDEEAQRVGELDFISGAGFGAFETLENRWRQDVAAGDGKIRGRVFRLGFSTRSRTSRRRSPKGVCGAGTASTMP